MLPFYGVKAGCRGKEIETVTVEVAGDDSRGDASINVKQPSGGNWLFAGVRLLARLTVTGELAGKITHDGNREA